MSFALPSGVVNTDTLYVYATNGNLPLGPHVKQPTDQTLVVLDYSGVTPAFTILNYEFSVDVSTNPELVLAYPGIVSSGSLLFLMSGGIAGQQYKVSIRANGGARVDTLVINIPSTTGTDVINPVPAIYNQIPLWGGGYVNTAVRAFWGLNPPSNPNVMDQWFNTTNGVLYEWTTDGATPSWIILFSPDYLLDAPHDNVLYGRKNDTWVAVPISEILVDAPSDGFYYARQNHLWAAIPRIPQPSDVTPLMDAPVPRPGVAIDFARVDHVHPTDSTLYSASNPAGYQTAANVTATLTNYMPLTGGTFTGGVSFQSAALFASPSNVQIGGGNPNYVLATNGAGVLSWQPPTVGISDAPIDTQTYARNHGNWVNITTATGVPEAPNDGQLWARENLTWVVVPIAGGAGIADAPNDSTTYARRNTSGVGAWRHITHNDITDWAATLAPYALQTSLPVASTTSPLMNGTVAIGTSAAYARADHAHPSDASRYAASNPANYISEAPNDSTAYARKSAGWSHLTHNDITDWATSTVPVTVSSVAPPSPAVGSLWWNTGNQQLYVWSGSAWVIAVTTPTIPEAPNDGAMYGRKVTSGVGAWSRLTHNDITDWVATLAPYMLKSGGTFTGAIAGTTFSMSGNGLLTGTLSVVGAGGGAGAYIGYFDGPSTRKGYMGQFGASGLIWALDASAISISLNPNGNIYLNGPAQTQDITASGIIHSASDITAAGNMSCGTLFGQVSTGGGVTAGGITSTGNLQVNGSEQVNGNFNCSNTVSCYTMNASYSTIYGNQTVNGAVLSASWQYVSDANFNLSAAPSERFMQFAANWYWGWNTSSGRLRWVGNPGVPTELFTIDAAGSISATANSFAHGAFYCDNVNGGFFQRDAAGNPYLQLYCHGDNNAVWANNRVGSGAILDVNPFFTVNGISQAFKPGGGVWGAISDRRIKDVLGDYKSGLKKVLQLQPVEFTYKGNDGTEKEGASAHAHLAKTKKKMVGYVADDLIKVLPEAGSLQKGFIDGEEVDDLKGYDGTYIIHALVNAVKELHAEVQALKAARA